MFEFRGKPTVNLPTSFRLLLKKEQKTHATHSPKYPPMGQ